MASGSTTFANSGKHIADMFTMLRFVIVVQLFNLTFLSDHTYSIETIQFWVLIGWISDVIDGKFARLDDRPSSFIGRNERKLDLIMTGVAHLYLSQFVQVPRIIVYSVAMLGLVAFIQMYRTDDTDLFLQMLYIAIISGYITIANLVQGNLIGYITVAYYLLLVMIYWKTFKQRAGYFLSVGTRSFN